MDTQKFLNWLAKEKKMSGRSFKDVLSRYGRICRMPDTCSTDDDSMDWLHACEQYRESSMFIKSQRKRTIALCLEFDACNVG